MRREKSAYRADICSVSSQCLCLWRMYQPLSLSRERETALSELTNDDFVLTHLEQAIYLIEQEGAKPFNPALA